VSAQVLGAPGRPPNRGCGGGGAGGRGQGGAVGRAVWAGQPCGRAAERGQGCGTHVEGLSGDEGEDAADGADGAVGVDEGLPDAVHDGLGDLAGLEEDLGGRVGQRHDADILGGEDLPAEVGELAGTLGDDHDVVIRGEGEGETGYVGPLRGRGRAGA